MKKTFARILSVILLAAMLISLVSMIPAAKADVEIDDSQSGSITVHKFAKLANTEPVPPAGTSAATGLPGQTVNSTDYQPIAGVGFTLYKFMTAAETIAFYNGLTSNTLSVPNVSGLEKFVDAAGKDEWFTDDEGLATIPGIPVGIYVLVESTTPDLVTSPIMDACLVSIPMVNTASSDNPLVGTENTWIYDVHVFPKNHEARGNINIIKTGNGEPLPNVEFSLEKYVDGEWKAVTEYTDIAGVTHTYTLTTDAEGKISIKDLPADFDKAMKYRLIEVSAPDGYVINSTPIEFTVGTDSKVTCLTTSAQNSSIMSIAYSDDPMTQDTLTLKIENPKPSMTKEIKKSDGSGWTNHDSFEMDDELYYRLIVEVPFNVNEMTIFNIVDIPQGIKVRKDTVVASTEIASWGTDDYVVAQGEDELGYTLTLTTAGKSKLSTYMSSTGKPVIPMTILYTADFLGNATTVNGDGNENIAVLNYIYNIQNQDPGTITVGTHAYTYNFKLTKTLENSTVKPNDVEFKLYNNADGAAAHEVQVVQKVAGVDGAYRLKVASDPASAVVSVMRTKDGEITIDGLDGGDGTADGATHYWLKETKTHPGYNLLSGLFEIKVTTTEITQFDDVPTYVNAYTSVHTHTAVGVNGAANQTATIVNRQGFVLPQTGSMGYLLFCATGILLVGCGSMLMLSGRKRKIR